MCILMFFCIDAKDRAHHALHRVVYSPKVSAQKSSSDRGKAGIEAAQRIGVQLPQARCTSFYQKTHDLAREAVNCNAVLGGDFEVLMIFSLE